MNEWHELRLWYGTPKNQNHLFEYKRTHMLSVLATHHIANFLVLDETDFVVLRIEANKSIVEVVKLSLEGSISTLFSRITVEDWSPTKDARDRILSAKGKLPALPSANPDDGWAVHGKNQDGQWVITPENLDRQVSAFSTFMARVLGQFTGYYLREMPYRVEDRWLMSLFVHLMLNSISTWRSEEQDIREFRYI